MINKNLMLVAMLSMGTALTTLGKVKPALASLTPPATYDYSYTWNAAASEQYLNVNGVDTIPLFTRTADGAYWNYTNTTTVIHGLTVTHTLNRSNTIWQVSGTSWKPDENRIGSDNTVGSVIKVNFIFDNQTNKDYKLNLDFSSSLSDYVFTVKYDNVSYGLFNSNNYFWQPRNYLGTIYIPAFTKLDVISENGSFALYFDAWYLKDLGVSDAWQQGYDADTQGILTDYLGTDAQQIGWVLLGIAAILFVFKGGK